MSPRQRNVVVGIVVLIGLGAVVWMVLLFAGRLANLLSSPGLPVTFTADRADGVADGSSILYLGVIVGRVTTVRRGADNNSVVIDGEVNKQPPLPANLRAVIQTQSAFSTISTITLEVTGPPNGTLAAGMQLRAEYQGSSLFPKQFTQLAEDLHRQELFKHMDEMVVSVRLQAERAGQLLESVQKTLGDEKMREDLRTAMANVRTATESADRVGANLEKFTGNLNKVGDQASAAMSDVRVAVARLGATLDQFQSVVQKVNEGKGTAGMLVNDPKLYQGLVDTTSQLNSTIADLRRLIEQWEQEGATIRLGK